jgi:hypothetical protein
MTTYTTSKGDTATVSESDVVGILAAHGVTSRALIVSVCLSCQSITEAPDAQTKEVVVGNFDMTCCGTTILV